MNKSVIISMFLVASPINSGLLDIPDIVRIESPKTGEWRSGIVSFYGFSTTSGQVSVYINEEFIMDVPVFMERSDVSNYYGIPSQDKHGWNFILNMNMFAIDGNIHHTVNVVGEFGESHRTTLYSMNTIGINTNNISDCQLIHYDIFPPELNCYEYDSDVVYTYMFAHDGLSFGQKI